MNPTDILQVPGTGDLAYGWITTLFPSGTSALGTAFQVFTSCLVFFGACFLGWHILSGIVQSAYSGKVLGERWHQIWAPLRVVLGFGMLIPVAGGFSSIHYVLRDVIGVAAVNIGNAPITNFIEEVANKGVSITPAATVGKSVIRDIMSREICFEVINQRAQNSRGSAATAPSSSGSVVTEKTGWFGATTQSYKWDYGQCGSLSYPVANNIVTNFDKQRARATGTAITSIRSFVKPLAAAFKDSWSTLKDQQTALNIASSAGFSASNVMSFVDGAAETFNAAIKTAAESQVASENQQQKQRLVEFIKEKGFMASGIYWRALSEMSARTISMTSQGLVGVEPALSNEDQKAYIAVTSLMSQFLRLNGAQLSISDLRNSGQDPNDGADSNAIIKELYKISAGWSEGIISWWAKPNTADPVGGMMAFGHVILGIAEGAMLGMAALAALATNGASSFFGAGGAFSWVGQFVYLVLITMFMVGIMQAYILPIIPFIMVFMMGLSWLVLYLEAAIAVVIWAFAFIRMDGSDFFDQHQKPGAALLFNLLLRPGLSMLVFIGSMHLLPVLLNTLSELWAFAFLGQQGGNFVGLVGIVVGLVVYTYLQWQICLRIFGLIPTIADRIGQWTGFGSSQGYGDGHETGNFTAGMIGVVNQGRQFVQPGGRSGGGGGGGGGGVGPKGKGSDQPPAAKNPSPGASKRA